MDDVINLLKQYDGYIVGEPPMGDENYYTTCSLVPISFVTQGLISCEVPEALENPKKIFVLPIRIITKALYPIYATDMILLKVYYML